MNRIKKWGNDPGIVGASFNGAPVSMGMMNGMGKTNIDGEDEQDKNKWGNALDWNEMMIENEHRWRG